MTDEDIIEWSPNYTLKLTDFKKEFDDRESVIKGIGARQWVSAVMYTLEWDKKPSKDGKKFLISEIRLKPTFNRNRSFFDLKILQQEGVSQGDIDFLILHEQGHFDLLEEAREKFVREISSRVKGRVFSVRDSGSDDEDNDVDNFLPPIFKEIVGGFEEINTLYDEMTNHGQNEPVQIKFNERFKALRQLRRRK